MDPQGRILLEQTGLAIADSESDKLFTASQPAMGVYVGVMHMEYIQFMSGMCHSSTESVRLPSMHTILHEALDIKPG